MEEGKKSQIAKDEEKVLDFWHKNSIFQKSLEKPSPKGEYVFYDGPPFATGLPHYGHILAGTMKDAIPRYRTMQGYHVDRKWGWDCHGLPIEKLVQEENNLATKKDIEAFGIKNFAKAAKASVFRYDAEWKKIIPRTGRWVDMEDQYTTMDSNYSESIWWAFKKLYKKGLVYEDFKSMHISPPLETPLSNFEVNLGYKDITDISVYVKFELDDDPGTFMLAWTTTPWSLFGNTAIAVNKNETYLKVKTIEGNLIFAKDLLDKVSSLKPDEDFETLAEFKGEELLSKSYKPPFDYYYNQKDLENHQNGWKIYHGEFVTTDEGTGVAHEAPAFGEDDLVLSQQNNLPFVQHVNIDGTIKDEIEGFGGLQAKPKDDPTRTDVEVIKALAKKDSLFAKEKVVHSYPHCWRTDAPLLNYALSSWFIKVTDYSQDMVSLNKKIKWVPKAVGEKRFGNWLENVKDWGVSRSRYWGTSMPIWKSEDETEIDVIGSIDELCSKTRSDNRFFVMRHGEADHNVKKFLSADDSVPSNLTERGNQQTYRAAKKLKSKKIDIIYCSPLMRTKQTANIIIKELKLDPNILIVDDRIKEVQSGEYNGKTEKDYHKLGYGMNRFDEAPVGGETWTDIKKRVGDFIYDIDKKHQGQNILIVSHDWPCWMLWAVRGGLDNEKTMVIKPKRAAFIPTGEVRQYDFAPIPHDDDYILDMHRPYIDEITYQKNGKEMKRIPEVFDTWVDSGSMPYAVPHYPFENKMNPGGLFKKSKGFPADFIAEGLDQTRGWFYTLLALNTALFGKFPYKNVIVNGLVLAEDGRKMSKRLDNYPDPNLIFNKFGADSVRYYMLASPVVEAEPLAFSEKGLDEVYKKVIARLLNVVTFFELYKGEKSEFGRPGVSRLLDQWILARLDQTLKETTDGMEKYELATAARPLFDFVDNLSTWYVRRSRDRFKTESQDKLDALNTLGYVLFEVSKIMAPFMPFVSEMVYQRITGLNFADENKSIHLENWSETVNPDLATIDQMKKIRQVVSLALESRDQANLKVRQPLQTLKIGLATSELHDDAISIISDEVNVKEVVYDPKLSNSEVNLDTEITGELKREGVIRELTRFIQNLRKEAKLNPDDEIVLSIDTNEVGQKLIKEFEDQLKHAVKASSVKFGEGESNLSVEGFEFSVKLVN